MTLHHRVVFIALCVILGISASPAGAAMDRDKLLTDPGVFGTFAVFKIESDWWKLDKAARAAAVAEVKEVFQKHADKVLVDTYLLRGLSERADFFVRVHSTEMLNNQNFLVDLMGTTLGRYLENTQTFNGITKKTNYVPGFPEEMKAALKTPPDPGAKPYVLVIPVRKDAAWWATGQQTRGAMMEEHTDATVGYLKTVKRKLYHASGLDDFDFITYFETAKLDDFNNLVIALEQVKENRHNKQFGGPTLLGTIRPVEEILEILAR